MRRADGKRVGEVEIILALSSGGQGAVQPIDLVFGRDGRQEAYTVSTASTSERVLQCLDAQEVNHG